MKYSLFRSSSIVSPGSCEFDIDVVNLPSWMKRLDCEIMLAFNGSTILTIFKRILGAFGGIHGLEVIDIVFTI